MDIWKWKQGTLSEIFSALPKHSLRLTNQRLYRLTERFSDTIRNRWLKLYGHILRTNEGRIEKLIFNYEHKSNVVKQWLSIIQLNKICRKWESQMRQLGTEKNPWNKYGTLKGFRKKENAKTSNVWTEERWQLQS